MPRNLTYDNTRACCIPYVQDTARRASRPRAKSQPYKSIEQCVREAKALGISYGQFGARGLDRM